MPKGPEASGGTSLRASPVPTAMTSPSAIGNVKVFWKIDYYDRAKRLHSPDPAASGLMSDQDARGAGEVPDDGVGQG